jgi:hypothetical protein
VEDDALRNVSGMLDTRREQSGGGVYYFNVSCDYQGLIGTEQSLASICDIFSVRSTFKDQEILSASKYIILAIDFRTCH